MKDFISSKKKKKHSKKNDFGLGNTAKTGVNAMLGVAMVGAVSGAVKEAFK
jgi:hypothetical protein